MNGILSKFDYFGFVSNKKRIQIMQVFKFNTFYSKF